MKKYINKHPKLKKLLKILGVVAIVLSFVLNAFVVVGLIANKVNETRQHNVVIPIQERFEKRAIDYQNESYYQTFTEMRSIAGYYAWKSASASYFTQYNYFYTGFSMSSSAQSWVSSVTGLEKPNCYWSIPDVRTIMTNPSGYTRNYVVSIQFKVTRDANSQTQRKDVILYTDDNNATAISYYLADTFYYDSNNNLVSSFDGILISCRRYSGSASDPFRTDLSSNLWGGFGFDADTFYGEPYLAQDVETSYQKGYNAGANDYYGIGYNAGYSAGYNEGSTGMTSNPFVLISQSFSAVASILNIQVLPNLTLGVLIFTPLIVTIIIVVVKMIRG